jgi:DNA-directed RNA polymerase specialized sigma24 family protein
LRYFEELSYKEICVQTDLPISTVKVTLLRAKKLLAQKINENGYQS